MFQENENHSAVLYGKSDLRVEPWPIPEIGSNDLLVKIQSAGICGTDITVWKNTTIGSITFNLPRVIGHEASGTVEKIGDNVISFAVGDRVVIEPHIPCQKCDHCISGNDNLCGNTTWLGCFTNWVTAPAAFCHKLPDNVSTDEGAMIEPLCCAVHACRRAGIASKNCRLGYNNVREKGQKVLICGSGAIGTLCLLSAKTFGVSKIVATDVNDSRLDFIKTLGADFTVNVSGKSPKDAGIAVREALGSDPDVVLECTGLGASIETAIHAVKVGGTVCVVGMGGGRVDIPILEATWKEIKIITSLKYNHREESVILFTKFAAVVKMVADGKINLKNVTTAHYKLAEIEQAFLKAMAGEVTKVIMHP
ncbi:alcohol dehydrogenase groES-like domain-containing protein [Ditylenchus destructor]|nr:alcohol dehydrogenase groES-like domain-containing protein [Ditylenchus destructor]